MKISSDSMIYYVNQGKADERSPTQAEATDRDVAIMMDALRIVQKRRPEIMSYAKLYRVSFVQLRGEEGINGQETAIPILVLRDPNDGREETMHLSRNGFSEADCLCLPLLSANAIASWIIKHLDRYARTQVDIAKRNLATWEGVVGESEPWPYGVLGFPNYTIGELPAGRYETDFFDKTNMKKKARLEIQPYDGKLRVRILNGDLIVCGTEVLDSRHWTILSGLPSQLTEELLWEKLKFKD